MAQRKWLATASVGIGGPAGMTALLASGSGRLVTAALVVAAGAALGLLLALVSLVLHHGVATGTRPRIAWGTLVIEFRSDPRSPPPPPVLSQQDAQKGAPLAQNRGRDDRDPF